MIYIVCVDGDDEFMIKMYIKKKINDNYHG